MRRRSLVLTVGLVLTLAMAGLMAGCSGGGTGGNDNGGGNGGGGNPGGNPGTSISVRLQIPESLEGLTLALDDLTGTHVVQRTLHDGDTVVQIGLPPIPPVPEVLLRPSITRADGTVVWQWVTGGQFPRGQPCYLFHNSDFPGPFWSVGRMVEGRITSFDSVAGFGVIQAVVFQ
ncbi:MAG: hypothetical protein Q7S80_00575 [bacterium]|nr:hypothetical protein [bacterium]